MDETNMIYDRGREGKYTKLEKVGDIYYHNDIKIEKVENGWRVIEVKVNGIRSCVLETEEKALNYANELMKRKVIIEFGIHGRTQRFIDDMACKENGCFVQITDDITETFVFEDSINEQFANSFKFIADKIDELKIALNVGIVVCIIRNNPNDKEIEIINNFFDVVRDERETRFILKDW